MSLIWKLLMETTDEYIPKICNIINIEYSNKKNPYYTKAENKML